MPEKAGFEGAAPTQPEQWVEEHGDWLYRHALARLRDPAAAEDAVQETLLAAVKSRDSFEGRAAERTWLSSILRHKIADHLRRVCREREAGLTEEWPRALEEQFDETGHWSEEAGPADWRVDAAAALEHKQLRQVLERCLDGLPPRAAQAFIMREMEGEESEQICKILKLTATNLWVTMHRARLQLRRCLEQNWFAARAGGAGR